MRILSTEFILYVADQTRSTAFYTTLLGNAPTLDVPGMTEFSLSDGCKLGLMPESGIARIISGPLRHPSEGNGIPRCELYLLVDDHRYVYGDMPPVTLVIEAVPSFRKGQLAVAVVVLIVSATHAAQATDGWKPVAPDPSTPLISHGIKFTVPLISAATPAGTVVPYQLLYQMMLGRY